MAEETSHPETPEEAEARRWIRQRMVATRRELLRAWLPWMGVALLLGLIGWVFVKPAPPSRIAIAAGPEDGAYYSFAKRYAETFAANDVVLDVRATAGTSENYKLLADGAADLAIVQGGVMPEGLSGKIRAIASLYLEPVWVFSRGERALKLRELSGRKVAAGPDGSGTRQLVERLLKANGVAAELVPIGGRAAAEALRKGEVDVAIFVISPDASYVRELLADANVHLLDWDRAEAHARRFRFLSETTLPRSAADLAQDLPRQDVHLVAPAANLVCRAELHPALIPVAAKAAEMVHENGDVLSAPKQFPSTEHLEWPLDPVAREYFKAGPPFLQKYLPFWAAATVDRLKYLLLPLLTLILPLMKVAPPLYVWRMRSRIYRWYRVVKEIDLHGESTPERVAHDLAVLRVLDRELATQDVPLSYMQEIYNLRLHVNLLRRRIEGAHGGESDNLRPV